MAAITSKLLNITRYRTARGTDGETIVDLDRSAVGRWAKRLFRN